MVRRLTHGPSTSLRANGGLICLLLLAACDLPRDTEATTTRVRGGTMRVGWVAGGDDAPLRPLVARLAADLSARAAIERGAAEPLLARLEEGELDLVVGRFDAKTPWEGRVTFSKPVRVDGAIEAKAAVRAGEHRWLMQVDHVVATMPGAPR